MSRSDVPSHRSPEEIARQLWLASPDEAANFARAEHEKACWDVGGDRAEFWDTVLAAVSALGQTRCPGSGPAQVPAEGRHDPSPVAFLSRRPLAEAVL